MKEDKKTMQYTDKMQVSDKVENKNKRYVYSKCTDEEDQFPTEIPNVTIIHKEILTRDSGYTDVTFVETEEDEIAQERYVEDQKTPDTTDVPIASEEDTTPETVILDGREPEDFFTKLEKVRRNLFKEDINKEVNTRKNVTETAEKEVK